MLRLQTLDFSSTLNNNGTFLSNSTNGDQRWVDSRISSELPSILLKSLQAELESREFRFSLRSSGRTVDGRVSVALGCVTGAVADMIDTEERLLYGLGSLTLGADQHCAEVPAAAVAAAAWFGSNCFSGSRSTFFFFKE